MFADGSVEETLSHGTGFQNEALFGRSCSMADVPKGVQRAQAGRSCKRPFTEAQLQYSLNVVVWHNWLNYKTAVLLLWTWAMGIRPMLPGSACNLMTREICWMSKSTAALDTEDNDRDL